MNGNVDLARDHCRLDLLGEKALAAHLGQRAVLDPVAGRLDDDDLERGLRQVMGRHQTRTGLMRLGKRQRAAARADAKDRACSVEICGVFCLQDNRSWC